MYLNILTHLTQLSNSAVHLSKSKYWIIYVHAAFAFYVLCAQHTHIHTHPHTNTHTHFAVSYIYKNLNTQRFVFFKLENIMHVHVAILYNLCEVPVCFSKLYRIH